MALAGALTNFTEAVIALKQVLAIESRNYLDCSLAIESRNSLNSQWTFGGHHIVENTIEPLYVHSRERLTHCIEERNFLFIMIPK